jgi:hypothetical protein
MTAKPNTNVNTYQSSDIAVFAEMELVNRHYDENTVGILRVNDHSGLLACEAFEQASVLGSCGRGCAANSSD